MLIAAMLFENCLSNMSRPPEKQEQFGGQVPFNDIVLQLILLTQLRMVI